MSKLAGRLVVVLGRAQHQLLLLLAERGEIGPEKLGPGLAEVARLRLRGARMLSSYCAAGGKQGGNNAIRQ